MSEADWTTCANYAIKIFEFSQQEALKRGLILVDTKYEFGRDVKTGIMIRVQKLIYSQYIKFILYNVWVKLICQTKSYLLLFDSFYKLIFEYLVSV